MTDAGRGRRVTLARFMRCGAPIVIGQLAVSALSVPVFSRLKG